MRRTAARMLSIPAVVWSCPAPSPLSANSSSPSMSPPWSMPCSSRKPTSTSSPS